MFKENKNLLLLYAHIGIIKAETGNHTDQERMCDTMAAKTSNLYARIEPEVKEEAESILAALGIPASNAINMFYKQIILNRGIPFEVNSHLQGRSMWQSFLRRNWMQSWRKDMRI